MKQTLVMMVVVAGALTLSGCQTLRGMNECMEPETTTTAPVSSVTTTKTTTVTHQQ